MIFGKYDEFRRRMTATKDFEKEWMQSPQTRKVFPANNPKFETTYGSFETGTARRVFMPRITHLQQSHHKASVAEALDWMNTALQPPKENWIPSYRPIWPIKEWATLVAMLSGLAALLPLGLILMRTSFFSSLQTQLPGIYSCTGKPYIQSAILNGVLMLLYFPIIFTLFGVHVYLVQIDGAFPLMMTNGIVWWFLWINVIGFFFFRRWFKKQAYTNGLTL